MQRGKQSRSEECKEGVRPAVVDKRRATRCVDAGCNTSDSGKGRKDGLEGRKETSKIEAGKSDWMRRRAGGRSKAKNTAKKRKEMRLESAGWGLGGLLILLRR